MARPIRSAFHFGFSISPSFFLFFTIYLFTLIFIIMASILLIFSDNHFDKIYKIIND